jgi:membrane protein
MSLTTVRLREAWNWGGLTLKELLARTYRQIDRHDTLDRAAAVAFYGMTALPPFLSLLLAALFGGWGRMADEFLAFARQSLPPEAASLIETQVNEIRTSSPTGLLSVATVVLLWSVSGAFVGVMDATNAAYGVRDRRPWWRRRLVAAILTVIEMALLVAALASVIAWPYVTGLLHLGVVAAVLALVAHYVVVVIVLLGSFALAYFYAPDVKQEWEWITPGSALGVLFLVLLSVGLRLYARYGGGFSASYGALAGVIVTMLWLYFASLALLIGAEINCVIEQAAPDGRAPGQRVAPRSAFGQGGPVTDGGAR